MKKIIFAMAAVVLMGLAACTRPGQFRVTCEGAADNIDSYVVDYATGDTIATKTASPGRVKIRGKAEPNALLAVMEHGDGSARALFFNDGTPVSVNYYNYHLLKGSEMNMKLSEYDVKAQHDYEEMIFAYLDMLEMSEAERIVKSEDFNERFEALHAYLLQIVEDNRDNLIPAAFLPMMYEMMEADELAGILDPKYAYANHPFALTVKSRMDEMSSEE